jgi:hypothetical protein
MKRVRYLAGLIGLAPAAGLAIPAVAHAATTPAHLVSSLGKTIRVPAISPDVCYGHASAAASAPRIAEAFFYNSSGCIGNVVEHVSNPSDYSLSWEMNIYHSHHMVGHQAWFGRGESHTFYVHKRFTTPVQVCVKAFSFGTQIGPACTTVF